MPAIRVLVGLLAVAGGASAPGARDAPALLTHPTADSRTELRRVVRAALGDVSLTLADDALVRNSELILEPSRPRDATGRLLDGRVNGRPERFRLVQNGSRCVLVHERTSRRYVLAAAACAPREGREP